MKEQQQPMTRAEMIALRKANHDALMRELHRKPSPFPCAEEEIEKAEQRLKRPKHERSEYTPPKPADHVTAFLVSPSPRVKEQDKSLTKKRKHVAAHTKATPKSWGKAGHQFSNKLAQMRLKAQKFNDDASYAR